MKHYDKLHTKIMDKLKVEPNLDESGITIFIKNNGAVIFKGKVKSYPEKYIAEEVAKKIENIKVVVNQLEVDLTATYKRSDAYIVQSAMNALRWNIFVTAEDIKVTVENGHLILTGEVEYYFQKERAKKAVSYITGITNITNNIIVTSNTPPANIKEDFIKEFERNARIYTNNIEADVNINAATLQARGRNLNEAEEAKIAAWFTPVVTTVNDLLTIGL
ncbi:BON domain-containing protein [Rickettsiales endosymbiont of Stachyamoeba lipophora]|uniref:BON domain-containing protein n=1 Tax=Rickettsiales endosymbiont of Stachyamoeba lipophora TaxID=2486578 RepID=UPI000F65606C|nr:BON domain-containing protein [Rickettsiales endosymbiont of Stachyamoeba lipophora]AZL15915.1 BON domain-containing protein [Rickettsiales endosymbiont of Stachyamoeba lipophora]